MKRRCPSRRRVLVTGGAGFIGSHLIDRLIDRGDDVLCIDNFVTGTRANIEHLRGHARFQLLEHDVTSPLNVDVDEIYNLACPASPVRYQHDPIETTRTSVLGAINMLALAGNLNCRILQASTSEVYGDPDVHPQPENYWGRVNPIGPRSCYDEGKRCAETLFFDYHRQTGLKIKIARLFNAYGPRMYPGDGRVVPNFVVQALRGEPLTVFGDGAQTRSFCYVHDLVDGLMRLMDSDDGFTGPVNLGNPHEVTILELASEVIRQTHSPSKIAYLPLPPDDPRRRRPDIQLAQRALGWMPTVSLREGLKLTIEYFGRRFGTRPESAPTTNGAGLPAAIAGPVAGTAEQMPRRPEAP